MKIQILRLDSQDDLASVRDRLAWIQAGRVILVWPREGLSLVRQLDLVLLQRQAERRGAQLGLVTRDPIVQDHARRLGIPLLKSEDSLEQDSWRRGRRSRAFRPSEPAPLPQPPPRATVPSSRGLHRAARWLIFTAAMLAPLTLAVAVLPSAEITLRPTTSAASIQMILTLDPGAESSGDGVIPAREARVTVQAEERLETSGTSAQPGPAATGEVVFTNLTSDSVRVPAGSGLRAGGADGPRYLVTDDVTVLPGRGQQVVARIQALQGGPQGNQPGGAIDTVDGPLGLLVSVTNPQPTTGGALVDRPSVSADDQAQLEASLRAELLELAEQSLEAQLGGDERLDVGSLRVVDISQNAFDHAIGEPTDSVGLSMTMDVTALVYKIHEAEAAARQELWRELPPGRALADEDLVLNLARDDSPAEGDRITLLVQARTYKAIDLDHAARLAVAQPPGVAASHLAAALALESAPEIRLTPSWLPRLPFLQHRIRFVLDGGRP